MGGTTGLSDEVSQFERLSRMITVWKKLHDRNRDVLCLGDANVCSMKCTQDDYQPKGLADLIQSFLLETTYTQIVREYTRIEMVRGNQLLNH